MHVLSLLASLLISATPATPQAAPIFVPLQTPPTCSSYGVKINVHGNAVFNVLCPNAPTSAAYYFSAAGGTVIRLGIARGAMATVGFDIDDENFVVGTTIFNQNGAKRYPTIWSPSGRENVLPEPTSTEARGISPSPQGAIIVGQTGIGTILPQAARIVPLPLLVVPPAPAARNTSALNDVNSVGKAVGELNGQAAAAILPGPLGLLPGFPKGLSSLAAAVNANGAVVGSIVVQPNPGDSCANRGVAFWSQFNFYKVLPQFDSCIGAAEDINDAGTIVGHVVMLNLMQEAVVFAPRQFDLNFTFAHEIAQNGWTTLTDAAGVNATNQLVGTGLNSSGVSQAFVVL